MDNLILSAYAPINEKGLNWGAGGPERWPGASPYMKSDNNEDQKGFHIFDWYSAISKSVTGTELPILLMGVGAPDVSDRQKSNSQSIDLSMQAQHVLSIYQLLNRERVNEPGKVEKSLDPVPDNVIRLRVVAIMCKRSFTICEIRSISIRIPTWSDRSGSSKLAGNPRKNSQIRAHPN